MVLVANGEKKLEREDKQREGPKKGGRKETLVETVYRSQKKWLGRTLKSDCWLSTVIEGIGILGQKTKRKEEEAMLDKVEAEFGCS